MGIPIDQAALVDLVRGRGRGREARRDARLAPIWVRNRTVSVMRTPSASAISCMRCTLTPLYLFASQR
jgi:hypothetical protein